MDINELLGIDHDNVSDRLADELVQADKRLLAELIRARVRADKTQAQVAAAMGVSQSAVARIEGGERDLHLSTLRRYAHAIGALVQHIVTPEYATQARWRGRETAVSSVTTYDDVTGRAGRMRNAHTTRVLATRG
ncbi:helix-turn-helix domain-containing protein [Pseudoclavibacter terrae]|uniref:helix-turn-helix domain-containing protein n=1 Tax=Pseudoclavibacter terrae TaxID=1530195 RepID=UPI00232BDD51|nr:helix-turn-helix domain-containing protein [Pseudoclavibacter terrae]